MKVNDSSFGLFTPDENAIDYYANDDMYVQIVIYTETYYVEAFSYDGSLEVEENYSDYETAKKLFDFVQENYNNTPPHEELQEFIDSLAA